MRAFFKNVTPSLDEKKKKNYLAPIDLEFKNRGLRFNVVFKI